MVVLKSHLDFNKILKIKILKVFSPFDLNRNQRFIPLFLVDCRLINESLVYIFYSLCTIVTSYRTFITINCTIKFFWTSFYSFLYHKWKQFYVIFYSFNSLYKLYVFLYSFDIKCILLSFNYFIFWHFITLFINIDSRSNLYIFVGI